VSKTVFLRRVDAAQLKEWGWHGCS